MKRCWSLVLFLWAAAAFAVQGEAPVSVGYQKTVEFSAAGATAAYSLDANVLEASAANGVVTMTGKGPGTTNVVVVTAAGVRTVNVIVPVPPPSLPPGFEPPEHQNAAEVGTYEF